MFNKVGFILLEIAILFNIIILQFKMLHNWIRAMVAVTYPWHIRDLRKIHTDR